MLFWEKNEVSDRGRGELSGGMEGKEKCYLLRSPKEAVQTNSHSRVNQ